VFGSLGGSVAQAMVADLVAPERHEAAYSSVRVASNLGVVLGPPLGGLMLVVGSWTALFPTVAVLSAVAWVIAWRFLPHRGAYSPEGPPERGSLGTILRDRPFLLFLGSAVFAWLVYVAYEVVLPVSLVDGFGYEPSAWGFLVWINPLLVTLFQVRLTRATAGVPSAPKLVVALLVMGLPYLLLVASHSVAAVVTVVVVFVIGEMLWVPTSQAVVAELAPADIRGAYMGAFGSAPAIGFAIAPLIGLQVRNSFGDDATWTMFAALGVVAGVLGGLALVGVRRRVDDDHSAVLEA
jgi:predicted MFS family arabinose efflux permease